MIAETIDPDLFAHFTKPAFVPVMYKHVKRGTRYIVISDNEYHLNTFSFEGSLHDFVHNGTLVKCELQFAGGEPDESGRPSSYGGPIVIYLGEDGKYWMRPCFEFHDGRFERVEV